MDNSVYRSTWTTCLPRFPVHQPARAPWSSRVKENCAQDSRQNTVHRHTNYVYSTSFSRARKLRRDRARMAAFILKKTAENLPFSSLSNDDLRKLGTNTSLRVVSRRPTVAASTQTEEEDEPQRLDVQVENEHLRQEIQTLKDDLSAAVRSVEDKNILIENLEKDVATLHYFVSFTNEYKQSNILNTTKVTSLEKELNAAKTEQRQLEEYCVTYQEQIQEAHSEIDALQMTLSQYQQQACAQNSFHGYQNRGRRNRRGR